MIAASLLERIVFTVLTIAVGILAYRLYIRIYRAIRLGKPVVKLDRTDERWKRVLLYALGQRKMFDRPLVGLMHLFIYAAFVLTQIELMEMMLDGVLGTHRILMPYTGMFYAFIVGSVELLSVLALVATIVFLFRRNVLKIARFAHEDLRGWPFLDANLILIGEILLILGLLMMNGADSLYLGNMPSLPLSSWLAPMLWGGLSETGLHIVSRAGWWLHMLVVYGFILYIPFSKHLHIFLAFPNAYYAPLPPKAKMSHMPEVTREIRAMFEPTAPEDTVVSEEELPVFGAKDVTDLDRASLLAAFTCTECGRCTDLCPANITGKKLSPRKIMMSVRDRAEEVIRHSSSTKAPADAKTLFDYISDEEIFACTTCMACVEACPVLIHPLQIIYELRRYRILTEAQGPSEWIPMFTSLENSGSVWQVQMRRTDWTRAADGG